MKRYVLGGLMGLASAIIAPGQVMWINEFHYDNVSTDKGEFVEVAVPKWMQDLASISVTLYNGDDGKNYGSKSLAGAFASSTSGDYTFYGLNFSSGLQNGPDGFALSRGDQVLQFLSYEGAFQATAGVASGLSAVNIGLAESGTTLIGASLGLIGMAPEGAGFSWAVLADDSPGEINAGQGLVTPVPETGDFAIVAGAGLLVFAASRHWKRRTFVGSALQDIVGSSCS